MKRKGGGRAARGWSERQRALLGYRAEEGRSRGGGRSRGSRVSEEGQGERGSGDAWCVQECIKFTVWCVQRSLQKPYIPCSAISSFMQVLDNHRTAGAWRQDAAAAAAESDAAIVGIHGAQCSCRM